MSKHYPSFTPTYHHNEYPAIDPRQPSLSCSGKIVLITGGGRGIGQAIAIAFAKAHATGIALLGRTKSALDETAATIQETSRGETDTFVVTADFTIQDQIKYAFDSTISHFGRVPDILVNNAGGFACTGDIADVDIDAFMITFDMNVRGPLTVMQTFIQAARKESPTTPRTIINLPSGAAHIPYAQTMAAYGTSKLANAKLTEYAHHENPDWNVFNMQPGVVATELARKSGRKAPDAPELPAGFAVWLAKSPEARKLNGRFVWANWDVNEVLDRVEEIEKRGLLMLSLKGWAEEYSGEDLKAIARGFHRNADREE